MGNKNDKHTYDSVNTDEIISVSDNGQSMEDEVQFDKTVFNSKK